MKTLYFKVSGQSLQLLSNTDDIVKGTRNYLRCAFSFEGYEWNGCKVVAEFQNGKAIPVINGSCFVPDDSAVRQYFKFRLIGEQQDCRVVTNWVIIKQGGE